MRQHHILYFSTNVEHIERFHAKAMEFEQYYSFHLNGSLLDYLEEKRKRIVGTEEVKGHICKLERQDLIFILDKQDDYKHLYIIVDYLSLFNDENTLIESADIVRRAILKYPEVNFLFDQTGVDTKDWISGLDFLLESTSHSDVIQDFHVFDWNRDCPFFVILMDFDNTFDGTNLRYAVRNKYLDVIRAKHNFSKLQEGRRDNLAISVEEEPRQNRFNSFALYANGFRVIPVQTARMLLSVNQSKKIIEKLQIVIRDCDLQFPDVRKNIDFYDNDKDNIYVYNCVPVFDVDESFSIKKGINIPKNNQSTDCILELIDIIRDYKKNDEGGWCERDIFKHNPFWSNIAPGRGVIFVTNGLDKLHISSRDTYFEKNKNGKMEVTAIAKPVCGIYQPFYTLKNKNVVQRHNGIMYKQDEDSDNYVIEKKRDGGNHSVPLNIYDLAKDMLERAENYYKKEKYIRAAVVASETMEVLNGFHNQMMAAAYHIKAIAENAIALDVIGANEVELEKDAVKRIQYIKKDVHRLVSYIEDKSDRKKHEKQILNHIFSDCRAMCRDNEYHSVESVFISAIAHGNDGFWTIIK